MKIGFTGSRSIRCLSYNMLKVLSTIKIDDLVITGGAIGADKAVENYCDKHNILHITVRPIFLIGEYFLHRNVEIVTLADRMIAFWDGKSSGTKFTIQYAKARGKNIEIVLTKKEGYQYLTNYQK